MMVAMISYGITSYIILTSSMITENGLNLECNLSNSQLLVLLVCSITIFMGIAGICGAYSHYEL